jgi:hypothetical protein
LAHGLGVQRKRETPSRRDFSGQSRSIYRSLEVLRWGLISHWAKDIKIGFSTFNTRGEDVETKPAFREASGSGAVCCRSIILCCNRIVGNLALAGGRAGAQFYHRYDHAERAVGRVP